MQTLTLKARTDQAGIIRLEIPTEIVNQEIGLVVVMQTLGETETLDTMGYPVGYFDETYGSLADDPIERNQPPYPDVRDELSNS